MEKGTACKWKSKQNQRSNITSDKTDIKTETITKDKDIT